MSKTFADLMETLPTSTAVIVADVLATVHRVSGVAGCPSAWGHYADAGQVVFSFAGDDIAVTFSVITRSKKVQWTWNRLSRPEFGTGYGPIDESPKLIAALLEIAEERKEMNNKVEVEAVETKREDEPTKKAPRATASSRYKALFPREKAQGGCGGCCKCEGKKKPIEHILALAELHKNGELLTADVLALVALVRSWSDDYGIVV